MKPNYKMKQFSVRKTTQVSMLTQMKDASCDTLAKGNPDPIHMNVAT